eukprot:Rmarinus@m.516
MQFDHYYSPYGIPYRPTVANNPYMRRGKVFLEAQYDPFVLSYQRKFATLDNPPRMVCNGDVDYRGAKALRFEKGSTPHKDAWLDQEPASPPPPPMQSWVGQAKREGRRRHPQRIIQPSTRDRDETGVFAHGASPRTRMLMGDFNPAALRVVVNHGQRPSSPVTFGINRAHYIPSQHNGPSPRGGSAPRLVQSARGSRCPPHPSHPSHPKPRPAWSKVQARVVTRAALAEEAQANPSRQRRKPPPPKIKRINPGKPSSIFAVPLRGLKTSSQAALRSSPTPDQGKQSLEESSHLPDENEGLPEDFCATFASRAFTDSTTTFGVDSPLISNASFSAGVTPDPSGHNDDTDARSGADLSKSLTDDFSLPDPKPRVRPPWLADDIDTKTLECPDIRTLLCENDASDQDSSSRAPYVRVFLDGTTIRGVPGIAKKIVPGYVGGVFLPMSEYIEIRNIAYGASAQEINALILLFAILCVRTPLDEVARQVPPWIAADQQPEKADGGDASATSMQHWKDAWRQVLHGQADKDAIAQSASACGISQGNLLTRLQNIAKALSGVGPSQSARSVGSEQTSPADASGRSKDAKEGQVSVVPSTTSFAASSRSQELVGTSGSQSNLDKSLSLPNEGRTRNLSRSDFAELTKGSISLASFVKLFLPLISSDVDRLRFLFRVFDLDDSQSIEVQELIVMLQHTDSDVYEHVLRMQNVLTSIDVDNDREIAYQEFEMACKKAPELKRTFFSVLPKPQETFEHLVQYLTKKKHLFYNLDDD